MIFGLYNEDLGMYRDKINSRYSARHGSSNRKIKQAKSHNTVNDNHPQIILISHIVYFIFAY